MGSVHNDLHSWAAKARSQGRDTIEIDIDTADRAAEQIVDLSNRVMDLEHQIRTTPAPVSSSDQPEQGGGMFGVTGARGEVEALAYAIWAHRCPGLLMDEDDDRPHYMEAAKAAFAALDGDTSAEPAQASGEPFMYAYENVDQSGEWRAYRHQLKRADGSICPGRPLYAHPPAQASVACPVCARGEVRHFSTDDGFWIEIECSAGGANKHGLNGCFSTLEHHPDGTERRREYIATDSPISAPQAAPGEALTECLNALRAIKANGGDPEDVSRAKGALERVASLMAGEGEGES